jgi:hypothetical protein
VGFKKKEEEEGVAENGRESWNNSDDVLTISKYPEDPTSYFQRQRRRLGTPRWPRLPPVPTRLYFLFFSFLYKLFFFFFAKISLAFTSDSYGI